VLAACKSMGTWHGPNANNVACVIFCGGTDCQNYGTS